MSAVCAIIIHTHVTLYSTHDGLHTGFKKSMLRHSHPGRLHREYSKNTKDRTFRSGIS